MVRSTGNQLCLCTFLARFKCHSSVRKPPYLSIVLTQNAQQQQQAQSLTNLKRFYEPEDYFMHKSNLLNGFMATSFALSLLIASATSAQAQSFGLSGISIGSRGVTGNGRMNVPGLGSVRIGANRNGITSGVNIGNSSTGRINIGTNSRGLNGSLGLPGGSNVRLGPNGITGGGIRIPGVSGIGNIGGGFQGSTAQGDQFSSSGAAGMYSTIDGGSEQGNTGTQTTQELDAMAPMLQGATNGTIGPQGADATYITGVNTAGTVRVNNLANLEALLNIIANGMEILGIAWGGPTMILGFMHMAAGSQDAMKKVLFGMGGVTGGLATPGCINWLVASSRDANLFS